ncbi:ubiquitin-like-conjugating enzyme ATG10 isoform X2 [Primulina huaijiensis]|uniref:ubiquitin-like-conjugating enzyme ATG10 isoform X2 n=1 Tax=Primulina huaijiensis TaxID=1492673 RepID=UPI003CC79A82
MESGDGTLSATEFRVAACAFSELWKTFNSSLPQWSWVPSLKRSCVHYQNMEGYLSLENVILPRFFVEDDVMEEVECSSAEEDDFIDTAKLVRNQDSGAHHYNFHIVYSLSYRVPVLYFRAYCSDGQPLALKDIEKDIPVNSVQLLTKSKWTFLTQELVNAESFMQLLLKEIYLATIGVHFLARASHIASAMVYITSLWDSGMDEAPLR